MKAINFGPVCDFFPVFSLRGREIRRARGLAKFSADDGACCCGRLDRRHFFQLAGSAVLSAATTSTALAAEGDYEAMLVSCIDPRMVAPVYKYMDQRGLTGQYSQLVIAGAAIAVVAPKFEVWRPAFWDNLATTVQLHHIKRLIAIDHRDCGAAEIALGRRASPIRRSKPRPTAKCSPNSVTRSASANPVSRSRPGSWRSTARSKCSADPALMDSCGKRAACGARAGSRSNFAL